MQVNVPLPVRYAGVAYAVGAQSIADATAAEMIAIGIATRVSDPIAPWKVSFAESLAAVGMPMSLGLRPSLLPSIQPSSLAAQTGTTVTVTATAHGLPATSFDGWRVWYPGSPTILAGWYEGFLYVDANTFTFTNTASQTVGSESVNGGIAVTAAIEFCSATLPGGALGPNGAATLHLIHWGGATAANKTIRATLAGTTVSNWTSTTLANSISTFSFSNLNSESKQRGFFHRDTTAANSSNMLSVQKDLSIDQVYAVTGQISAAGDYMAFQSALLLVRRQS